MTMSELVVTIPDTWDTGHCSGHKISPVSGQRLRDNDIVIRSESCHHGPVTHHSGGCGDQGDGLDIPLTWILENMSYEDQVTNDTSRDSVVGDSLAWQFIKLRYGVFSVARGHDLGCSNILVCDHNEGSRHETMCGARSVGDVIRMSSDFTQLRSQINSANVRVIEPEIKFVQQHPEQIVILLETSAVMLENDMWRYVAKSVKNMILHDIRDNTRLGLVTFSNLTHVDVDLTPVTTGVTRSQVADIVPDQYRVSRSMVRCVETGVRRILSNMVKINTNTHIVIITSNNSISHGVSDDIREFLMMNSVSVSTVLLSSTPVVYYDHLAEISGGTVLTVDTSSGHMRQYLSMIRALQTLVTTGDTVIRQEQVVQISETSDLVTQAQFDIAGAETEVWILVEDVYSHHVQSVQFVHLDTNTRYGPYYNLMTSRAHVNMLSVLQSPVSGARSGGRWEYLIQWYQPERSQSLEAGVMVTSHRGEEKYEVRMWSSIDQLIVTSVTQESPLILHVSVVESRSRSAVSGASVTVQCTVSSDDGVSQQCDDLKLREDGHSAGLYSRTMIHYPGPGRYQFSVLVTDNDGQAVVSSCDELINTGRVRIVEAGEVKHIVNVPSTDQDLMPPSRVVDLAAEYTESGLVRISFTAPGDDYDHGSVDTLRLLATRNRSELLMMRGLNTWTPEMVHSDFRSQSEAGDSVVIEVDLDIFNENIHLAVVGVDDAVNIGEVSNIVTVFLAREDVDLLYDVVSEDDVTEEAALLARSDQDYSLILALSGAIVFLSSFLALGILYFIKVLRSHHHDTVKSQQDGLVSSETSSESDRSNMMMKNSLLIHSTLRSPSLGQSTPTYWSATDLLRKHESRLETSGVMRPEYSGADHSGHRTHFSGIELSHDTLMGQHTTGVQRRQSWIQPIVARELFLDSISEEQESTEEDSETDNNVQISHDNFSLV